MLSAKSEQFLIELRMYLIQHGKSDADINDIVGELESHLLESEQNGKDVESIVGKDPKQYMKTIGEALPTDKQELLILIPATILVILAYLCYIPAIAGNFQISQNILLWGSFPVLFSLIMFSFVLFKGFPKFHASPVKLGILISLVNVLVVGVWVGSYFWINQRTDSNYFIATSEQSYGIAAVCILIFISYAIYTKSWITIIVAAVMTISPVGEKLIPKEVNEDPFYITWTVVGILLITALLIVYFVKKKKEKPFDAAS